MLKTTLTALIVWSGLSGAALALSITPETCVDPDGTFYKNSFRYGPSLVATVTANQSLLQQGVQQVILASCEAQKQVIATVPDQGNATYEINVIFEAAVLDTATHTFADLANAIDEIGYDASVKFFNNGTCLCNADVLKRIDTLDGIEVN